MTIPSRLGHYAGRLKCTPVKVLYQRRYDRPTILLGRRSGTTRGVRYALRTAVALPDTSHTSACFLSHGLVHLGYGASGPARVYASRPFTPNPSHGGNARG